MLLDFVLVALAGIPFLFGNNIAGKRLLELTLWIHLDKPLAWIDWLFGFKLLLQLLYLLIHHNVLLVQLFFKVLDVTLFSHDDLCAWLHLNEGFLRIFAVLWTPFHHFWLLRKMLQSLLILLYYHLIVYNIFEFIILFHSEFQWGNSNLLIENICSVLFKISCTDVFALYILLALQIALLVSREMFQILEISPIYLAFLNFGINRWVNLFKFFY